MNSKVVLGGNECYMHRKDNEYLVYESDTWFVPVLCDINEIDILGGFCNVTHGIDLY